MNIASRIADLAEAGDVLTSEETMRQVETDDIEWTLIGPAKLKGSRGARDALPRSASDEANGMTGTTVNLSLGGLDD